MNNNALAVIDSTEIEAAQRDWMPVFSISQALARRNEMIQYVQKIMIPGTDFGKIPGGTKDVLLKPGAEKLCSFFGLSPGFSLVERTEDWTGADHGKEPFFYYLYRCRLSKNGRVMGEGDGSCNSWESKYRYRNGERVCPNCGKATIIKGKAEYGGGFICFAKKGGCNAKFNEKDKAIIGQEVGRVPNPDISDIVNTIQKMAQKRALIAAVLIGVNASDYFTQDIDDMQVIEVEPDPPAVALKQSATPKAKAKAPQPQVIEVEPEPEEEIIPVEIPDKLQQMYNTLSGHDKFAKLAVFSGLKADLKRLLSDDDCKYYEILNHYGVEKSDQFKKAMSAQCAARDMYLTVQKALGAIVESDKIPYVATDGDVDLGPK